VTWTLGVEVELLAPSGASRRDLARSIADAAGGSIRACFHPQSEPSAVPGTPVFQNLTLGYEAVDSGGGLLARCLDDLTLQADLDRNRSPVPGWYRIASDDPRLLNLIVEQCDPGDPIDVILEPIAALFGTRVERNDDGLVRVSDRKGASIAIAAPLPGERERPCELVTPPMATGPAAALDRLLGHARDLGFGAPAEGATHLHFDGSALCEAPTIAALVGLLSRHADALCRLFKTNPRCQRLGAWPRALRRLAAGPGFRELDWPAARAALAETGITKYCDFNLLNLVEETPGKHTFEVRILPVYLQAERILEAAEFFEAILDWSIAAADGRPIPSRLSQVVDQLSLPSASRARWLREITSRG
jgi:hypothetical protein